MKVEDLAEALKSASKPSELYVTPDGSRLVLLAHSARVLGLFAPHSEENFFWTNPALSSVDPGALFRSEGWHNSGGDRTWVGPETDLHFPKFPDLSIYKVPVEVDPGRYEIERPAEGLKFVNRAELRLFRSRHSVQIAISKSWDGAPNPLRYEEIWSQMSGVEYAGYAQKTSLKLLAGSRDEAGPVGAWNLIQLPPGGSAFFPLHSAIQPTVYVGSSQPGDVEVEARTIRYNMRSSGIHKIGIRAAASTGRAGYVYSTGGHSVLVVRNVFIDPSGEYIDVPWTGSGELGERGFAFQACSVNHEELGTFCELEYHAPAIGRSTRRSEYEDVSQLWAFRGPRELIRIIGQNLLSPDF